MRRSGAAGAPHPVMQRFVAFAGLLGDRPGAALACDVRDVIFQAPPFEPAPQGLEAFVEADGPLAEHAFNMKYLRALFGQAQANRMADKSCLCVGTLVGPRAEVSRLSRLILTLASAPRSEIGGAFGADQAAFNLAIHQGLVAATVRGNYGRVATLGLTPGERLRFEDGQVVNPDGGISPIVHQHDRHPHLDAPVHARLGRGTGASQAGAAEIRRPEAGKAESLAAPPDARTALRRLCQAQALATMTDRSDWRGSNPRSRRARAMSDTRCAGSPARRSPEMSGSRRPLWRMIAAST